MVRKQYAAKLAFSNGLYQVKRMVAPVNGVMMVYSAMAGILFVFQRTNCFALLFMKKIGMKRTHQICRKVKA